MGFLKVYQNEHLELDVNASKRRGTQGMTDKETFVPVNRNRGGKSRTMPTRV